MRQVRSGWNGIRRFVVPTNQGSGMTARLGPSSQQEFSMKAGKQDGKLCCCYWPTESRASLTSNAEAWKSGTERYLRSFLGSGYAQDRGLGFSPEAAPLFMDCQCRILDGQGWAKAQSRHM